jgi:protoporphyrinogen oxidase
VLGAGIAGITAADALSAAGIPSLILEATQQVGGLCRTERSHGFLCDIGGHRFFTKASRVRELWLELMGADMLERDRLSRIYYQGRFFDYPLRPGDALRKLGLRESARCVTSYGRARLRPRGDEGSFEAWVSNRFGDRLFDIFFRTYTEKVWGIPTSAISADWAAQRIRDMELSTVLRRALLGLVGRGRQLGDDAARSLVERFHYPTHGPGMLCDRQLERAVQGGATLRLGHRVVRLEHDGHRVQRVVAATEDGERGFEVSSVLSSIPFQQLALCMDPPPPPEVLEAARSLSYRSMLVVFLALDRGDLFPDQWVYVHEPSVRLGRIQNFGNWSPHMVPDPGQSGLGLEYFCTEGDALWSMDDDALIGLATRELRATGLDQGARVLHGAVFRAPGAYPLYVTGYERHVATLRAWLGRLEGLQPIGRYGMFKYNNADHSVLTALLAVENLQGARHDVWAVNTEQDYLERDED